MSEYALQVFWYLAIGASVVFYCMLDGFDLGVGSLQLFVKEDRERRIFLNSIGPVWDGNEVWLVVIIGALFSGFPEIYATVISSFYNLVMVFLAGLIFRAVAIEFRSKRPSLRWRKNWDIFFSLSSYVITFLLGVLLGNLVQGIAIDQDQVFVGSFKDFFTPYTVIIGVLAIALFMMHGCIYLILKTKDALQDQVRNWVFPTIIFFVGMYVIATVATFIYNPYMVDCMRENRWFLVLPALTILAIANIPREIKKKNEGRAFISSCLSIIFLFALFALGTFPVILRSTLDPKLSLTLLDSSSLLTLRVLFIIAIIGVPMVIGYGYFIYRTFRGKVELEKHSY